MYSQNTKTKSPRWMRPLGIVAALLLLVNFFTGGWELLFAAKPLDVNRVADYENHYVSLDINIMVGAYDVDETAQGHLTGASYAVTRYDPAKPEYSPLLGVSLSGQDAIAFAQWSQIRLRADHFDSVSPFTVKGVLVRMSKASAEAFDAALERHVFFDASFGEHYYIKTGYANETIPAWTSTLLLAASFLAALAFLVVTIRFLAAERPWKYHFGRKVGYKPEKATRRSKNDGRQP